MQKNGKRRTRYEIVTDEEETSHSKGRNFALAGGIICLLVLLVYVVVAAYPAKLFSEERKAPGTENQAINPQPVHVVLPDSPLKTSSERLFASTSKVMQQLFGKLGKKYTAPSLQLFEDTITAYACRQVLPASGAFYCGDQKQVFIDLAFFRAIEKADTDRAPRVQAYIIAHQVGHHIEDLMGITAKIEAARGELSDAQYRKLTFKTELLADYYAGVWAHYAFRNGLDYGDAQALVAYVTRENNNLAKNTEITLPDTYKYSELGQRADSFYRGYTNGDLQAANVFTADELK